MAPTADLFSRIPSDDSESDTPEKCRKRCRRRIEMRRMRISSGQLYSPPQFQLSSPREMQDTLPNEQPHSVANIVENLMPDFGFLSIKGLSESMDDAVFVKQELYLPVVVGGSPLHFFAVYDGHGGSHVSTLCKEMMQKIMVEELTRVHISKATATSDLNKQENEELEEEDLVRVGIEKSFQLMDEVVALSTCKLMELAVAGSTAVVALLSRDHIVVANCGDSRAVVCRDGRAVPLSFDHKPEIQDELERIRAAGRKLIYQNGGAACGDNLLKRAITSTPEISTTEREAEDECLILASDGLWDVLSDDLACKIACACLREGSPATAPPPPRSRRIKDGREQVLFPSKSKFAAAILCRLALARGSHDNISVMVVDLLSSRKAKTNNN